MILYIYTVPGSFAAVVSTVKKEDFDPGCFPQNVNVKEWDTEKDDTLVLSLMRPDEDK